MDIVSASTAVMPSQAGLALLPKMSGSKVNAQKKVEEV